MQIDTYGLLDGGAWMTKCAELTSLPLLRCMFVAREGEGKDGWKIGGQSSSLSLSLSQLHSIYSTDVHVQAAARSAAPSFALPPKTCLAMTGLLVQN